MFIFLFLVAVSNFIKYNFLIFMFSGHNKIYSKILRDPQERVNSTMRRTIIHVLLPVINRPLSAPGHDTWIQVHLVTQDLQLARSLRNSQNPTRSNRCSLCVTYRKKTPPTGPQIRQRSAPNALGLHFPVSHVARPKRISFGDPCHVDRR